MVAAILNAVFIRSDLIEEAMVDYKCVYDEKTSESCNKLVHAINV